jgi:hypothetical protein
VLLEKGGHLFGAGAITICKAAWYVVDENAVFQQARNKVWLRQVVALARNGQGAPHKGVARHEGHKGWPRRPKHAAQLSGSPISIHGIGQMVKRPQAQHGIECVIVPTGEIASIGLDDLLHPGCDAGLIYLGTRDGEQFGGQTANTTRWPRSANQMA